MDYHRILRQVQNQPWAVRPETLQVIQDILAERMRGERKGPEFVFQRENHFSAQTFELTPPRNRNSRVYRRGAMAYIPVQGVIGKNLSLMEQMCGGYSVDQLARDVDEVMEDASVRNVLFDYDSPGGQVTGVPEAADMLADLRKVKQTYAFTGTQAASAAYWLYSQAQYRYVTDSALVGSVGVLIILADRTKQLEAQGITPIIIKAGEHKGAGLPGNPLTEEEIAMLQAQVDLIYQMMVNDINSAHAGIASETLQGQVFFGIQGIQAKLADATVRSLGNLVAQLS